MLEYKEAVRKSCWASQSQVIVTKHSGNSQDMSKYFESFIVNVTLSNVNAFFIADKKGKLYKFNNSHIMCVKLFF